MSGFINDTNKTDNFDRTEVVVGDKDNPNNKQTVDRLGNAHTTTRFQDEAIVSTGLLAVATTTNLFEHFYKSGLGPNIWSEATNSGGSTTFNANQRVADITLPTTAGAYVYRQTRKRFRYYPGRSMLASMTFNAAGTQTNIRKRFGYFDVNDGLFLEFNGADISFKVRTSSSGTPTDLISIPRASWNDPLDGTGPSGETIDFTKTVFMIIEFLWQGAGYVKLSFLQGRRQLVAVDRNFFGSTNGLATSFMANPNLVFRIEVENTGTSSGVTVKHVCTALKVFTDDTVEGIPVAVNNGTAGKSVTNTPLISLRVNAATPTRLIEITNADVFIGGNNTAYVNVYLNPTLTAATWVNAGSASQYDISATSFTGGSLVSSKIVRGNTPITLVDVIPFINNILGESITGTKDIVSIVVESFAGTVTAHGTLEWKEL